MRVPLGTLRTRLVCLVIVALIPTLVLTLFSARERLKHEVEEAHNAALLSVKELAKAHAEAMEQARLLLAALVLFPSVGEHDSTTCSGIFTHLQKSYPSCIQLGAIEPDGRVICSAGSSQIHENIVETHFFQRLLDTRDFSASDYSFVSASGVPVITLARPVLGAMRQVRAVVYASMDLSWTRSVLREGEFPENTSVLVVDNSGRILIHQPNPEQWSTRIMPESPVVATMLSRSEGTCELPGVDGVERFFAFTTLWSTSPNYLHVAVGIPMASAFAEVRRSLALNLTILGILLVLAFVAAFWGTDFLVLRQIKRLLHITRDVTEGNLSVRTGPPYGGDELGELARAFDKMSEALELREIEREETSREILRQSALLDAVNQVLQKTFTADTVKDVAGKCIAVALKMTGSEMGFVGEVNDRGLLCTIASVQRAEEGVKTTGPEILGDVRDLRVQEILATALEDGESIIVNDPESHPIRGGTPNGHASVRRFLGVPLKHAETTFGFIAAANKNVDYSREDLQSVETLAVALVQALTRKRTEEALRQSEENYRTLFESSRDAILILDRNGFVDCNKAAFEIFGCVSKDQFLSRHPGDLAPSKQGDGRDSHAVAREYIETAYREGVLFFEFDHLRMNGTVFTAEVLLSRLELRGQVLLQAVLRDISRRRKMEEQLRIAQKLEAMGTLAGGIAHDFNNVLGIIMGYAELAEGSLSEGSVEKAYLHEILKACSRARDVIKQILMVSRSGGEMERQPLDVRPLVLDTLKLLRASLPSTIEIQQRMDCKNGTVLIHPVQVHQIVTNLCANAAHAMEEKGGVIRIGLDNVSFDSITVPPLEDMEPGAYVRLAVSDTGHGMSQETLDRIFDPYFTTKEIGKGSGLGLSVVRGIVKRLRGTIAVYSEVGRGTTFQVYLPQHNAPAGMPIQEREPVTGGNERILFVDDEAALVDVWKSLLQKLGYMVVAVTNAREALTLFQVQPADFDLVITDFTMPRMTGLELAREVSRIRPDVPVILCTGLTGRIIGQSSNTPAVRAVLMKPLNMREVADTIRSVLEKKPG